MNMTDREYQIIRAVDDFGQLKTSDFEELFFHELRSKTPMKRTLARLTQRRYLARLERPMPGGNKGGSGQYIYQLGFEGWKLVRGNHRYRPYRQVNPHMLAISQAYVAIKSLEHGGRFEVVRYRTEPKNWVTIGQAELRPDLYVEVADAESRSNYVWWLEVDRGFEQPKQLKEKMAGYYHAWQHSSETDMQTFPLVIFLVPDQDRLDEIAKLVRQGPEEAQALFEVRLSSEFPPAGLVMQ